MEEELKRHIKLLAEKFNHEIGYEKNVIVLRNTFNVIRIWVEDKYGTNISFNTKRDSPIELKLGSEDFYDIFIEVLMRKNDEYDKGKLILGAGIILTIEEWIKEEGEYAKERLEELRKDIENDLIQYRNLDGNRYKVEFFKGVLILIDELGWTKSNVISI